jgi:hypothetical protein
MEKCKTRFPSDMFVNLSRWWIISYFTVSSTRDVWDTVIHGHLDKWEKH